MIDKVEFKGIRQDLQRFEQKREAAIRLSRDIIKLSKEIIYAIHRGDMKKAEAKLKDIRKKMSGLPEEAITGIVSAAKQEYVEAVCFYDFIKSHKIQGRKALGVGTSDYLAGICDFSGELVRRAVKFVLDGKPDEATLIRDFVEALYGEFLELDLQEWELRKKYDSIKYNLKKLEDLMYDLHMKGKHV